MRSASNNSTAGKSELEEAFQKQDFQIPTKITK